LVLGFIVAGCGGGGSSSSTPNVIPPITEPPPGYTKIALQSEITNVQPMTGIVLWDNHPVWRSSNKDSMANAISLEYSYLSINEIVSSEGVYNWDYVEDKLDAITARNHQAIFRLYYTYVGRETTVPDYIKALPSYNETQGMSEQQLTYFPDWSNSTLQAFTKEFHTQFAQRYNNDNRIAFLQLGFGLWGEYHIYDGPMQLGVTFPSKAYQTEFLQHVNAVYTTLPWSISIDAFNDEFSPVLESLQSLNFGLFDDSFMQEQHSGYNERAWNAFNYEQRYKTVPFGGEFSYEAPDDQANVLIPNTGAYGFSYEEFASKFRISYMIGNDVYTTGTANEQSIARIKEASVFSGFELSISSFATNDSNAEVVVTNTGIAPIYYDAYVTVNSVRASESLKGLLPNAAKKYFVASGGSTPVLRIESDYILGSQEIEFKADL